MRFVNGQRWLSTHEAARKIGVNPGTIQRWLNTGKAKVVGLVFIRDPVNDRWLIEKTSLHRLLRKYTPTEAGSKPKSSK